MLREPEFKVGLGPEGMHAHPEESEQEMPVAYSDTN